MRKSKLWIPYNVAAILLLSSDHPNGLARRRRAYPQHFADIHGITYMSHELFVALLLRQNSDLLFQSLKTEVNHG